MNFEPLIDTHCHLDFDVFQADHNALFASAHAAGVTRFIVPSVGAWNWQQVETLSDNHPGVYYALGMHPYFLARHQQGDVEHLATRLSNASADCVAVGECGLDFFQKTTDTQLQLNILEAHLMLAKAHQLPVILHCRRAHGEMLKVLKKYRPNKGGVVHGFSGSYQQAMDFFKLGFVIGVGGTITYERAKKTRDAISRLPLEALVLETDSPDMPLAGFQGEPNKPDRLPLVLRALDEVRKESIKDLASATVRNSEALFGL
ncbi:TatD family hydrolase [Thaumasiovibrio subtropicus]|uniref:TatD family hydrolase n=1 Tax=Thaumasiovibrio subtropicus TaxID=1891207 RepID=UPI000B3546B8|nr:TatD family hydrolase [Thaumasiovibrio subtropicus]